MDIITETIFLSLTTFTKSFIFSFDCLFTNSLNGLELYCLTIFSTCGNSNYRKRLSLAFNFVPHRSLVCFYSGWTLKMKADWSLLEGWQVNCFRRSLAARKSCHHTPWSVLSTLQNKNNLNCTYFEESGSAKVCETYQTYKTSKLIFWFFLCDVELMVVLEMKKWMQSYATSIMQIAMH